MKSRGRNPGIGICWFLGACLILTPQPSAQAQSLVTGLTDGVAKNAKALDRLSTRLPPDVDEKVPPVEVGETCALDEVMQKAEKRTLELVQAVDRFTATESVTHESINKHGIASSPERRKFAYVVAIQEVRQAALSDLQVQLPSPATVSVHAFHRSRPLS